MFRKIGFGAAAALTVGMLAVGCSDDGDTIILGGSDLRPGAFPGSQVDQNNLAADGRAFTPRGQEVQTADTGAHPNGTSRRPEIFWNVTTGEAIMLFVAEVKATGGAGVTAERILYASRFNGTSWSAPVQIRGRDGNTNEDPTAQPQGYKVLWLNTTGNTNANAAARNGDAIILFSRGDLGPAGGVGTTDETANIRLWWAYFSRSAGPGATTGAVVDGFMTEAKVVDDDNRVTGGADPNVESFGFASSSHDRSHTYTAGVDAVDSGEVTNEVVVFYAKAQSSGATAVGRRFKFLAFDLNGTSNNPPTTGGTVLVAAQIASLPNTVAVDDGAVVHNNVMFWRTPTGTENDVVVTATVFSAAGVTATPISVGSTVVGTSTDTTAMPTAANVYGNDHGLTSIYIFTTEEGFHGNGAVGNRASQRTLIVRKLDIDQNTGAIAADGAEPARIDEFRALVIAADNTGTNAPVEANFETRMNRPGTLIFAVYRQNNTSTNTPANRNLLAKGVVVQTRRDATARTLANSVSASVNAAALPASAAQAQADVTNVAFQADLATGHAHSQGGLGLGCVFQSNPNRVNFTYRQRDDQATAAAAEDLVLMVDGLLATPDTTGSAAPTLAAIAGGTSRVIIVRVDQVDDAGGLGGADHTAAAAITDVIAVDMGDDTSTTTVSGTGVTTTTFQAQAGRVLVFYVTNANNQDNLDATNAFLERRLFVFEQAAGNTTGTSTAVSSRPAAGNTQDHHQVLNNSVDVIQVETNPNVAQDPSHRGTRIHVYWLENASRGANNRLATRSYEKPQTTQTAPAVAFADRWTPALTTITPVFIDLPSNGAISNDFELARNGLTVAVFFRESEHLLYQETSSTAALGNYYTANGLPSPQLIDNESTEEVIAFLIKSPPRCDNLSRTIVIYVKRLDPGANDPRVLIRVRN
ncbi:MAG: hypothetical protein M9894_32195 [Planctomycetes bacterium]|nr:hypothetical protein [Planctomycetota bacterium]